MLLLLACASSHIDSAMATAEASADAPETLLLADASVPGLGRVDLLLDQGRFALVGEASGLAEVPERSLADRWVVPAFIDSHVHLAYLPAGDELSRNGVAAAVDLAAPLASIDSDQPLRVLWSGPMITAVGGYPTQGWGSNGYGLQVQDEAEAREAVRELHARGADLVKVPLTGPPSLSLESLRAVVEEAHGLGLVVAAHAMSDEPARLAAGAGVDLLAHTPTASLTDPQGWTGRAVVSTLGAFGGSPVAVANLRALREAGATVLYGTDLGNTSDAGIDRRELQLMVDAGLDGQAILDAGTQVPAAWWGLDDLGSIEEGKAASFLVLDRDPLVDPLALAEPVEVWMDGVRRK